MENKGGIVILGLLAACALLLPLLLRRREASPAAPYHLVPVRRLPQFSQPQTTYTNEETWDVEYTEDGLVKRVVVHRRAVQE